FLAHVERILAEVEAARASVDDSVRKPKGKLRIAAPTGLGRRYVGPALCDFLGDYPLIEVQLDLLDRPVSLQEDGYDVAVRGGERGGGDPRPLGHGQEAGAGPAGDRWGARLHRALRAAATGRGPRLAQLSRAGRPLPVVVRPQWCREHRARVGAAQVERRPAS